MLSSTVDVLWTARYDYEPGWSFAPHRHEHFQMMFFVSGRGAFRLAQTEGAIRGGTLILIKLGEAHSL